MGLKNNLEERYDDANKDIIQRFVDEVFKKVEAANNLTFATYKKCAKLEHELQGWKVRPHPIPNHILDIFLMLIFRPLRRRFRILNDN